MTPMSREELDEFDNWWGATKSIGYVENEYPSPESTEDERKLYGEFKQWISNLLAQARAEGAVEALESVQLGQIEQGDYVPMNDGSKWHINGEDAVLGFKIAKELLREQLDHLITQYQENLITADSPQLDQDGREE